MASTKEEGAAAATGQLSSMSLGESAEREKNETVPNTKNGTPTKKLCSACGKKSNTLKKCTGCKCVWYCDKDCRNIHRKEHTRECLRILKELVKRGGELDLGTELDIGPLGQVPPREECPICMLVLPISQKLHTHFSCCGKKICAACNLQHSFKSERTCAFCRTPVPDDEEEADEEYLVQLRKRVELKDPAALCYLAVHYGFGTLSLPVDQAKCIELLSESADLGFPNAQYNLGAFYHNGDMGLEQDIEEAIKYYKEAADGGDIQARHILGCAEDESGDDVAAMRHWRLSASGGHRQSMEGLIECFEDGLLHHGDLAETLQAMHRARSEMKSADREEYIAYLKTTGEYKAEYEK